jgi:lysylphosphatidylglycerol synthetase-like protein (DUF2156 family)
LDITTTQSGYTRKILNLILLIVTTVLGIVTFFAVQDIIIEVTAYIVAQNPSEEWGNTIRDTYIVISARNLWVFVGGILLLMQFIIAIEYHPKRLGQLRTTQILGITLAVELLCIGLSLLR